MGLDRDDTIVRRRLRQKLEFLTEETAETAPPDAELQPSCNSMPTPSASSRAWRSSTST